jgi:V/A-type H+-transporting ATPase subunit E
MSEHIQPLLERIRSEGLKQAEAERESLLKQAQADAAALVAAAKNEADTIRSRAEKDAATTSARAQAALQQAARDLLLRLRGEIARQIEVAARKAASAPLSSIDVVTALLRELVKARGDSGNVTVETGSALAERLRDTLPALLKDAGAGDCTLVMNPRSGAGLQLRFGDSPESIDLSDAALAEWISSNLRPELAALLAPAGT